MFCSIEELPEEPNEEELQTRIDEAVKGNPTTLSLKEFWFLIKYAFVGQIK